MWVARTSMFSCDARQTHDVTVIDVAGELDLSSAPQLCARVEETFRDRDARVVIDLSRLSFCDSTGLRALLGAVQEARVHDVPLRILPPRAEAPARTFEIAGSTEFLPLAGDEAQAVGGLTRDG